MTLVQTSSHGRATPTILSSNRVLRPGTTAASIEVGACQVQYQPSVNFALDPSSMATAPQPRRDAAVRSRGRTDLPRLASPERTQRSETWYRSGTASGTFSSGWLLGQSLGDQPCNRTTSRLSCASCCTRPPTRGGASRLGFWMRAVQRCGPSSPPPRGQVRTPSCGRAASRCLGWPRPRRKRTRRSSS